MKIAGIYSFNGGQAYIEKHFPYLLDEVKQAVAHIDAAKSKTKQSAEKTMLGKELYSPRSLNAQFKAVFEAMDWQANTRIPCDYPSQYYVDGYIAPDGVGRGAFRELDFLKEKLGVEVQFGKYAFMVYNVCAKMTIFHNRELIDAGVEIVPVKEFASNMSTGVSYFEQFVWDLEQRGVSDIDIPVLILGITSA